VITRIPFPGRRETGRGCASCRGGFVVWSVQAIDGCAGPNPGHRGCPQARLASEFRVARSTVGDQTLGVSDRGFSVTRSNSAHRERRPQQGIRRHPSRSTPHQRKQKIGNFSRCFQVGCPPMIAAWDNSIIPQGLISAHGRMQQCARPSTRSCGLRPERRAHDQKLPPSRCQQSMARLC
jgi:hypothetical protein